MILDLTEKTPAELKALLERVKVSDAPVEVRQKNIENIEKFLRMREGNPDVMKEILEGMADISDIGV